MPRPLMTLMAIGLLAAVAHAQVAAPEPTDIENAAENLVKILRTSNKAQTNKYVCETLVFENVNPYDVINFLWAPVMREEGGIFSFVAPDGRSGRVVVICPEYQLPWLRQLAADLDRPNLTSAPGSKYIYYRMRHRNVANPGLLDVAAFYGGATAVMIPDVETNSVLIFDAPGGADDLESAFMETLDQPLNQLQVEVKIYEIDVTNDGSLGLDYMAWKNGPGRLLGQFQARGEAFNVVGGGHSGSNSRASGFYLDYPVAFLDFLAARGKASLLTNTRLTMLNRVPALMTAGEQVLYYEVSDPTDERQLIGATGRDGRPVLEYVEAAQAGVELAIVPTIGERTVTLDLDMAVVSLTGFDGRGFPTMNSRRMNDSISVAVDDTVLFGGLTRERTVRTTEKIPVLGSLPIIGFLFGGETTKTDSSMIVVSLTPHLLQGESGLMGGDQSLIARAKGDEVVVLPASEFSFDQNRDQFTH